MKSILIALCFCSTISYAQVVRVDSFYKNLTRKMTDSILDVEFSRKLSSTNTTFNMPKGYIFYLNGQLGNEYDCGDGRITSIFHRILISEDSSVCIGITLYDTTGSAMNKEAQFFNNYDPERAWFYELKANNPHYPTIYYSKRYLKRKFNADVGGEYVRHCSKLYLDKYKYYKTIFIHKAYRGYVVFYYFYSKKISSSRLEQIVKLTSGIIRYNK